MGRCALIFFICAGTAAGQSFSGHSPNYLFFCDQAARNEGVVPPVALVQCGRPEYTGEARIAHLAGIVTMSLTIDDEGMPSEIHVLNPLGLGLDESAVNCMRQSRYSPAQKDGKPVPLKMDVSLAFEEHWDSDWHLGAAVFQTSDGTLRPFVVKTKFPGATGDRRSLKVCVHLTVGKDGSPRDLQVASPQDTRLDREAIAIIGTWRFRPGIQNRQPVDVPAVLTLVHGPTARAIASSRRAK
ncbi:MAG TPA: TonB family protein [Bryobacteraceae bacterium]|nr:TonB family protein [Bryobacteraceae bacterium]